MAKYTVLRGKVTKDSKNYPVGSVIDITVKEAGRFPKSMLKRVTEPPTPTEKEDVPKPVEEVTEPEPAPAKKEERIRVTI